MEPFRTLQATAIPLPLANVDTDQLVPARFMQRSRADGYGDVLLHDLRFDADGQAKDVPLNRPPFSTGRIMVARRNFGCGSSREAAVYALADFGIRCVLAPSFGDIFALNAVNNGVLPGTIGESVAEALLDALERGCTSMVVDLEEGRVGLAGQDYEFGIDTGWRKRLLNGWDDIDLTLQHRAAIADAAARARAQRPWIVPTQPSDTAQQTP